MFPAVISQLTYWYRPDELSMRLLYFCELNMQIMNQSKQRTDLRQTFWAISRESSVGCWRTPLTQYRARTV
jgi:hypothetical protein